jgi:hypothetical protein
MPVRRRKTKANATASKKAEEVAAVAATVAGAAKKGSSNHDTVTLAGGQDKKKKSSKELTKLLQGLGLGSDTTPTTSPTFGGIDPSHINSLKYPALQRECKLLRLPATEKAAVLKQWLHDHFCFSSMTEVLLQPLKAGGGIDNVSPSESKPACKESDRSCMGSDGRGVKVKGLGGESPFPTVNIGSSEGNPNDVSITVTPTTSPTSGDIKSTTEAVCAPAKYKCKNFETYESPDRLSEGAFWAKQSAQHDAERKAARVLKQDDDSSEMAITIKCNVLGRTLVENVYRSVSNADRNDVVEFGLGPMRLFTEKGE